MTKSVSNCSTLLRFYQQNCTSCSSSLRRNYSQKVKSKNPDVARFVRRQLDDEYVRYARMHDYRARSAFKLLQLNEKLKIISEGDTVIDVGAAPGSWCQVLSEIIFPDKLKPGKRQGYILGVDIQSSNIASKKADITRPATHAELRRRLNGRTLDVVLSDMAPSPTGDHYTDHYRIIALCRCLLGLITSENAPIPLKENGNFLCKIWDGVYEKEFTDELKKHFRRVRGIKPDASRNESSEKYLYAHGFIKRL
ncbi:ftsJ-like methyltransferase domain-containing protein [Ditylenchus destructor]|uniref:rRNA methyltransferase 2, mitochondrial n=1 Tax=Ditylenchus destructor TaxID=166010 RepID=A0AAD4R5H3_9BILA|nr:ftsJ-like methyltransferase domain-containing protein [Ditylenchus destructor]